MTRLFRCLVILLTLFGGGRTLFGASTAENNAFNDAAKLLKIEYWDYAERDFGDFIQKYPKSSRVPEAILYQAEARYKLGQYAGTISLLSTNLGKAGTNEDSFLYWIAEAHIGNSNYTDAAGVFARLIGKFPDSDTCLAACVGEAAAFAKLEDWSRVIEVLEKPGGVFQRSADAAPASRSVAEGYIVLGEAQLARRDFTNADTTLRLLASLNLKSELNWHRGYLQCRVQQAEGRAEDSLQSATNLLSLAGTNNLSLRAVSSAFLAGVLEQLDRLDEAIAAYQDNIVTNAPVEQQRQALLKIAELRLRQGRTAEGIGTLEDYLKQYPEPGSADVALLMLGELQLKQYAAGSGTNAATGSSDPASTNLLAEARSKFDRLLNASTNSPLGGKALLDKGWCFWMTGDFAQSEACFQAAAERLPVVLDQAVARFKWADAQFMRGDFGGALTNYEFVAANYDAVPGAKEQLCELALYQSVRAALNNTNLPAATGALRKILDWYPDGFAGDRCLLLVGQGLTGQKEPALARELYAEFEKRSPTNALLPEIRLAAARTYEQEGNWPAAISQYADWVNTYTNQFKLPQAEFRRALDHYMAGQETNALALFTDFVARFSTNELVPQAQWWIANHYFRQGDNPNAEKFYQFVFQNTNAPSSELAYEARMMAGRVAADSQHYRDAIDFYFTALTSDSNCPPALRAQALFARGDAQMNLGDTNWEANLLSAIAIFKTIAPTNDLWAPAQGRMGDCYLQLAAKNEQWYAAASNAYQQVIDLPQAKASFAVRCQAKVGLGVVAERLAGVTKGGAETTALLKQAMHHYLDVFNYNTSLRDGERPDLFWVKKAGMEAGRLAEQLGMWGPAYQTYKQLRDWFPTIGSVMELKMLKIQKGHPEAVLEK